MKQGKALGLECLPEYNHLRTCLFLLYHDDDELPSIFSAAEICFGRNRRLSCSASLDSHVAWAVLRPFLSRLRSQNRCTRGLATLEPPATRATDNDADLAVDDLPR